MIKEDLIQQIKTKKSYLCVGLDSDITKIPTHLLQEKNPILSFNKALIDATKDFCVSYKINTAFYEAQGVQGWQTMEETLAYIPSEIFTIADAKRGDIGNTSAQYAKAFFETIPFDAITVAPYMGKDSLQPFLDYKNKWTIVLGLTSNEGANDFEILETEKGKLYEEVIRKISTWGTNENTMFVVGATQNLQIETIRKIIPNHFLLIPGVGAQGGNLQETSQVAMNNEVGILVNSSRQIIYASNEKDFAEKARNEAQKMQLEMKDLMK
ncbi:MAG: orotidine-5'-phosphate decarboxylase [Chitinophagaceae bacterium]|nr:orotidine-5'-phosphate decarboxylase [Chitinophagaceae bacterium]